MSRADPAPRGVQSPGSAGPAGPGGQEASDQELLVRIGAGDTVAIGLLYDRYAATLLPLTLRIVRDRAEAEDVLHDAFIAVSERAGQYSSDRGSVAAWLVTLARNLAIDRTRRRDRRGTLAREVIAHEPVAPPESPESQTADALERTKIRRALATLPAAQRATLEVAFFEGLSYPEIAARENVPLGTIKSRAARALAALREALVAEGLTLESLGQRGPAAAAAPRAAQPSPGRKESP
jgi:RNA polymerase sigma-70 factor (ECF subfamily)